MSVSSGFAILRGCRQKFQKIDRSPLILKSLVSIYLSHNSEMCSLKSPVFLQFQTWLNFYRASVSVIGMQRTRHLGLDRI